MIRSASSASASAPAPTQKARPATRSSMAAAALDNATEPVKMKELSSESRQAMMGVRAANKWTQVELNRLCGFPVNTIREMEAGRQCPNPKQLSIINRVLKTQLKVA